MAHCQVASMWFPLCTLENQRWGKLHLENKLFVWRIPQESDVALFLWGSLFGFPLEQF